MQQKRVVYIALSAFMFAFFASQAMCWPLLTLWLKNVLHLSSTQTGMAMSAVFIAATCSQPLYGFLSDKAGLNKTVMAGIAILVLACGFLFAFVFGPLLLTQTVMGAVLGGIYVGVTFYAGSFAIEAYTDRAGRKYGFEFAKVRLWGSLGFAFAAFFSGDLFNIDPRINFFLSSLGGLLMLAILFLAPIKPGAEENIAAKGLKLADAVAVLGMKKFWRFMVVILGVTTLYLVYDQQFPIYFAQQFRSKAEGTAMFGYLQSAQIFVEAGGFFLAPMIISRTGAKNGLLIATAIMLVRIAGSGLVTGPLLISCMKMLHSLELPILVTAIFRYIADNFEARLSATLYLVSTGLVRNIGIASIGYVAGVSYDLIGYPHTYLVIAAIAAVFWVASFFALAPSPVARPNPQTKAAS